MKLYFHLPSFPRTITRQQWREIWRWKRVTVKDLARRELETIELLRRENIPDHIKRDTLDKLINPPLLVHDLQRITYD